MINKEEFETMINNATYSELLTLQEMLDREIRLSETVIKEGEEEDI